VPGGNECAKPPSPPSRRAPVPDHVLRAAPHLSGCAKRRRAGPRLHVGSRAFGSVNRPGLERISTASRPARRQALHGLAWRESIIAETGTLHLNALVATGLRLPRTASIAKAGHRDTRVSATARPSRTGRQIEGAYACHYQPFSSGCVGLHFIGSPNPPTLLRVTADLGEPANLRQGQVVGLGRILRQRPALLVPSFSGASIFAPENRRLNPRSFEHRRLEFCALNTRGGVCTTTRCTRRRRQARGHQPHTESI